MINGNKSILSFIVFILFLICSCSEPVNNEITLTVNATFIPGQGVFFDPDNPDLTKDYSYNDIDYIYFWGHQNLGGNQWSDPVLPGYVNVSDSDQNAHVKSFQIKGFKKAEYAFYICAKMKTGPDIDYENDEPVCNIVFLTTNPIDMRNGSKSITIDLDGPSGPLTIVPQT